MPDATWGQPQPYPQPPPSQAAPQQQYVPPHRLPVRHQGEIPLLVVAIAVAMTAYILVLVLIADLLSDMSLGIDVDSVVTQVAVLMLVAPVLVFVARGAMAGKLRSNSVRMSPTQFPEAYAILQEAAARWNMKVVPEGFVVLGNGSINAFAFGHGWRRFVAIHSDLFEVGGKARDPEALKFVIGHEVGHIAAGHTSYLRILAMFAMSRIPVLGPALSRAQEYTADNYGYDCCPHGNKGAIQVLSVGKYLNKQVEFDTMADRAVWDKGFFVWLGNLQASHPVLTWRAHALRDRSKHGSLFLRPSTGAYTPGQAGWFPAPGPYLTSSSSQPPTQAVAGVFRPVPPVQGVIYPGGPWGVIMGGSTQAQQPPPNQQMQPPPNQQMQPPPNQQMQPPPMQPPPQAGATGSSTWTNEPWRPR